MTGDAAAAESELTVGKLCDLILETLFLAEADKGMKQP
jgi:hypothetical protein